MTHNLDIYYFINKFNISELKALDSNIKIIFRNYEEGNQEPVIRNLASFCKKNNYYSYRRDGANTGRMIGVINSKK